GSPRQLVGVSLAANAALVRDEMSSRTLRVSDTALIHPASHFVRRRSGMTGFCISQGVGLSLHSWWSGCFFVACFWVLAFPCFLIGLFALPLCGAAPTFLCRPQRKVGKRK